MARCGIRYQSQATGASEGGRLIAGHYCRRFVALLQICMPYFDSRILAGALAASLVLFSCHSVFAVPMRCSGEQTTSNSSKSSTAPSSAAPPRDARSCGDQQIVLSTAKNAGSRFSEKRLQYPDQTCTRRRCTDVMCCHAI